MGLIAYCKHQVTLSCGFKTQTFCLVQVFLLLAPRRLEKIRVMFALMGFLLWPFMVAILEHARSKTMYCQCSCFDVVSDEVSGIQVKATHVPSLSSPCFAEFISDERLKLYRDPEVPWIFGPACSEPARLGDHLWHQTLGLGMERDVTAWALDKKLNMKGWTPDPPIFDMN